MCEPLTIDIFSFGFQKSGIPNDESGHKGGYVFDCRALPNPYRDESLRPLTGRDAEIIQYFSNLPQVEKFIGSAIELVTSHADAFIQRGFSHLMVSFGCTGGQHRSVYCAEQLAKKLRERNYNIKLTHIELDGE
jgi:RNase adaptor protein for sRNA GlmZ degradation